jgi:uncharacterized protein (DUF1697 family)
MGKEIGVIVRTAAELKAVLKKNPFPKANPAQIGPFFFASPLSKSFMDGVVADIEEVVPAEREVHVYYPNGMGRTRLKLPSEAKKGTVRNINTIGKLVMMAEA